MLLSGEKQTSYLIIFKFLLLGTLIYFPVFAYLDVQPLRLWDESRVSMNAYEMSKNGNWLITHFQNKIEMWNLKPPFLIWVQVIFFKLFGTNDLALRLPSAFAGLLTCVLIMAISMQYIKKYSFGFISIVILITNEGYILNHSVRSCEYDAMLTLFIFLYSISFFAFKETGKNKFLYLTFMGIALAVLTKGVAGLLFIPGLFIYSIISKRILSIFKNYHFYFGLLVLFIPVFTYYYLRELHNPGYWSAVCENELGGRYFKANEGHTGNFWFYLINLKERLGISTLLFPFGLMIGVLSKNSRIKKLTIFLSTVIITYFIIISFSATKLIWYDIPMFPFIAMTSAFFIQFIFEVLMEKSALNSSIQFRIYPYLFIVAFFYLPYNVIIAKTYLAPEYRQYDKDFYASAYFLKKELRKNPDSIKYYIISNDYKSYMINLFYVRTLNDKGHHYDFKNMNELTASDKVIAFNNSTKTYIETNYKFNILRSEKYMRTYKILGCKSNLIN